MEPDRTAYEAAWKAEGEAWYTAQKAKIVARQAQAAAEAAWEVWRVAKKLAEEVHRGT